MGVKTSPAIKQTNEDSTIGSIEVRTGFATVEIEPKSAADKMAEP
jgi:hypothetical protein